jgi:hypothetical protein
MSATVDSPFDKLVTPELIAFGQSLAEAVGDLPKGNYSITVRSEGPLRPLEIDLQVSDPVEGMEIDLTLVYTGEWHLVSARPNYFQIC